MIEQKIQKWRAECQVLARNDFKMFLYVKFTDKLINWLKIKISLKIWKKTPFAHL